MTSRSLELNSAAPSETRTAARIDARKTSFMAILPGTQVIPRDVRRLRKDFRRLQPPLCHTPFRFVNCEEESGGAQAGGGHAREAGIHGRAQAGKAAQILFGRACVPEDQTGANVRHC